MSETLLGNSKILYANRSDLDFECKHFELVHGKTKTCKLQLNYPDFNCSVSTITGRFGKQVNSYLSQAHIMKEINEKRPVCISLSLEGTVKKHYILVYGYTLTHDNFVLHLADPWDGFHDLDYANLNYLYRARWTKSYLTA